MPAIKTVAAVHDVELVEAADPLLAVKSGCLDWACSGEGAKHNGSKLRYVNPSEKEEKEKKKEKKKKFSLSPFLKYFFFIFFIC